MAIGTTRTSCPDFKRRYSVGTSAPVDTAATWGLERPLLLASALVLAPDGIVAIAEDRKAIINAQTVIQDTTKEEYTMIQTKCQALTQWPG